MKRRKLGAYAGLDLSLAGTGGVLLDAKGDLVSVLAFTTSKREADKAKPWQVMIPSPTVKQGDPKAMWARTVLVAAAIRKWVGENSEPGCLVAIEDHAFGARGTSIYQLGHLHGMVRRDLQDLDLHWLLVAPTELKAAVTGKGNADKKAMMAVPTPKLDQSAFGASTRNNVVDAYWLARLMMAWGEMRVDSCAHVGMSESMLKVMRPHKKQAGLLRKELLP